MTKHLFFILVLFLGASPTFSQEYKTHQAYQEATGQILLANGCWLKSDRKQKTEIWDQANSHNLMLEKGYLKYTTARQKRDFYAWFDATRIECGHETKWFGLAQIALGQLARMENGFIRKVIVRNKEIEGFVEDGCTAAFEYAFLKMRELYTAEAAITGQAAADWDEQCGRTEQCEVLDSFYRNLPEKAFMKLERMAKGKGIYRLGLRKKLRYTGDIYVCELRYQHGMDKLLPHYLRKK